MLFQFQTNTWIEFFFFFKGFEVWRFIGRMDGWMDINKKNRWMYRTVDGQMDWWLDWINLLHLYLLYNRMTDGWLDRRKMNGWVDEWCTGTGSSAEKKKIIIYNIIFQSIKLSVSPKTSHRCHCSLPALPRRKKITDLISLCFSQTAALSFQMGLVS